MEDENIYADEDCPGCAGGDLVPAVLPNGFWSCPVCDAVWEQDDEEAPLPMPETDPLVTLRERVRERLRAIFSENMYEGQYEPDPIIDAILREFRLQPVAWGRVTEGGEVEGL